MKRALLYLTEVCQYTCDYCMLGNPNYNKRTSPLNTSKEGLNHMINFFDTRGQWHIHLTGGEPTLHPHFIELMERLTQDHMVAIDTNNGEGIQWIDDLIANIDPEKVSFIHCSLHDVDETSERLKGYIDRIKKLQQGGFNVYVSYVASPKRIPFIRARMSLFKSHEIPFVVTPLRTSEYPKSYTTDERMVISEHMISSVQKAYLDLDERLVKGKACTAGHTRININGITGNIKACWRSQEIIGNIFEDNLSLNPTKTICDKEACTYYFEPHDDIELLMDEDFQDIMNDVDHYDKDRYNALKINF